MLCLSLNACSNTQQKDQQEELQVEVGNEDLDISNDNIVATHDNGRPAQIKEVDSNGNILITDLDDTGKVLRKEYRISTGEVIVLEEDSRGVKVESRYDQNGDLIVQICHREDVDGNMIEEHYDREGILMVTITIDPNGNEEVIEHHQEQENWEEDIPRDEVDPKEENTESTIEYGKVYTHYNGGTRVETVYNADGTNVVSEYYSDGTYNTKYHDANGRKTREVFTNKEGWYYDLTPYPNGKTYIDIHISPSGHYTKQRYKENGDNIDFYEVFTDGMIEYRVANDNGSIASVTIDRPDGSHFESKHDSNGVIISGYEKRADGTEVYQSYHSNGARKEEKWYFPDGLIVINTFDTSDNLINTENILPVVE